MRTYSNYIEDLKTIITPSWISALLAVVLGLAITAGVIVAFSIKNSTVQQQLVAWQDAQPQKPLTTPDQELPENDKPTLQGSWPLILIWSLIGLATYTIAAAVVHGISELIAVKNSLTYLNARPRSIVVAFAERLAIRLSSAAVLAGLIALFLSRVIPYSISASHASAADLVSIDGGLYAVLSFSMIVVALHAITIFLRLTLGKKRIASTYL